MLHQALLSFYPQSPWLLLQNVIMLVGLHLLMVKLFPNTSFFVYLEVTSASICSSNSHLLRWDCPADGFSLHYFKSRQNICLLSVIAKLAWLKKILHDIDHLSLVPFLNTNLLYHEGGTCLSALYFTFLDTVTKNRDWEAWGKSCQQRLKKEASRISPSLR